MKRHHIVPNLVTAFSLSCGLFVIFKMSMITPGTVTYQDVLAASCILMLAAFLDMMDGAIARAMKVESEFGGVFDSMADAVSFGVAPCVVVLKTLSVEKGTVLSLFLTIAAMIYAISGVLRLVRFNVTRQAIKGDVQKMAEDKANFTGLPIPGAASIVTATSLLLASDDLKAFYICDEHLKAVIVAVVFFVIGYLMVSRWKFPSIKTLRIRVYSFQMILLTTSVAALVLIGALHQFAFVFAAISWGYLLVSLVLSFVRLCFGKRVASLEDFEPDDEPR